MLYELFCDYCYDQILYLFIYIHSIFWTKQANNWKSTEMYKYIICIFMKSLYITSNTHVFFGLGFCFFFETYLIWHLLHKNSGSGYFSVVLHHVLMRNSTSQSLVQCIPSITKVRVISPHPGQCFYLYLSSSILYDKYSSMKFFIN